MSVTLGEARTLIEHSEAKAAARFGRAGEAYAEMAESATFRLISGMHATDNHSVTVRRSR